MNFKWHPYPEEKPSKSGYYLCTLTNIIVVSWYLSDKDWWTSTDVIAWAELPKPYQMPSKALPQETEQEAKEEDEFVQELIDNLNE